MRQQPVDHLSYSSIASYLSCGKAWERHYINKEDSLSSPALVFGSAFHTTAEGYLVNKGDLFTAFTQALEDTISSEQNPIVWGEDSPESLLETGRRIFTDPEVIETLDSIELGYDSDGKPLIELKVELQVPYVQVPIVGYIDFIDKNGVPGDFKTSGQKWNIERASNEMQPLFYLAALNQLGMTNHNYWFQHVVVTKSLHPTATIFEHQHNPEELDMLKEIIQGVWRGIKKQVYTYNPTSWKCSAVHCPFYSTCVGKNRMT